MRVYKVIISDDHMPVLEFLQAGIPWNELGLELVTVCSDGEEALQACHTYMPDILITDIGMPIMDGLTLIEETRKVKPDLKTVILSCHEDFQYAQRAVKLNVKEYILKETLELDQLIAILKHIVVQLNDDEHTKEHQQKLSNVIHSSRSSLKTVYLKMLLEQPIVNERDWIEKASTIGIQISPDNRYLPIVAMLDRQIEVEQRFGGASYVMSVVENALEEATTLEGRVILPLNEKLSFILYPYPKSIKVDTLDLILKDLKSAQKLISSQMAIGISFYLGESCENLNKLKKQLIALSQLKTYRFYCGENKIEHVKPITSTSDDLFVHFSEAMNDFRNCIRLNEHSIIQEMVQKWILHISTNKYPVDAVRSWTLNIVTDIELKSTVMQHFMSNYSTELLQQTITRIDTLEQLEDWFTQYLIDKQQFIQSQDNGAMRKEIADAKRFVMLHLNERIGMEEMARRLNLNSTHFSRIFKKETGETFVEFVTRMKMERAQELLDKSAMTVEQIANEIAIENVSYFNKLFRSFAGITPNEYRKRI
jgi:two-component system response regulator YesN